MNSYKVFIFCFLVLICKTSIAQLNVSASEALIKRVVPTHASHFRVESLPQSTAKDEFEIESAKNNVIILRGNNGVAVASALYYYLKEYAHCQITWNGTNLKIGNKLPALPEKIHKTSPYEYRYYMNYCTFNYSMSWWDWSRWEKEIDWMALHGINMPLAITGQEYVWNEVYKSMGFTDEDLSKFFSGPAYFAWFWMGNLDAWGGPLPKHWMESHRDLQQKILKRERSFGMKPVLPAFTGHVPPSFNKLFPNAKLKKTNWTNGFADTYILDSEDTLFAIIGKKFLELQTKLYGTDHLYSADTFNENEPPSNEPDYLSALSKRVYEGMHSADRDATWVMQGWLFFSDRKFWNAPQIKALLDAVPNDHMILLDLATEIEPVWKRTEAFYGKPWIWNMLHNFGGNISLFGRIDGVATGPPTALHDPSSGLMKGIGLTMEGIEQNPVLYELLTDHTWQDQVIDLDSWLPSYVHKRYGSTNEHAVNAWRTLRTTVYNGKTIRDGTESIIASRPTFENGTRWVKTILNYEAPELLPAWDEMIKAIPACKDYDGFQYDIVDVTRQVLANYALPLHHAIAEAYQKQDAKLFADRTKQFIKLIEDMDRLLATRNDFLLGRWLEDARRCGITNDEKNLYEQNARDLITLWGDEKNRLHEYSCRQWSGLMNDFYKPRWNQFFSLATTSLQQQKPIDYNAFEESIQQWEWKWVLSHNTFPTQSKGNAVEVAKELYQYYRPGMEKAFIIP
ncbi:MAG TPA: alpha-N-acetylglucosaminidase [Cyclobacteriaceae bacterium]|jgi:alpha-N-acetylglucosaminidase|nr:alpha-N-acetylglucosaminidase [Cyclobacteriaceae bacterium]